jgi:pyruvate kinase
VRNTKIVCTLGPASNTREKIGALLEAGMDVVRLNFSHGRHEELAALIGLLRDVASAAGRLVPVIADLQGPKIRTGRLPEAKPVELVAGATVRLVPGEGLGAPERILVDYPRLAKEVRAGERVLLADGSIELEVIELAGEDVVSRVVHGGRLGERKGVNLPGTTLSLPSLTEKDRADLQFALAHQVDFVALSFVREPRDLGLARDLIAWAGARTPLIAKLEKPQALEHLDEILLASDAVMVARGDLGVELSSAQVPVEQKRIIARAAALRRPVITATQMLESMMASPRPTRAEASDVANAVFDGSDALMLSGETAAGQFPVEAVQVMSRIIEHAEGSELFGRRPPAPAAEGAVEISDAVAETAVSLSAKLGVKVIAVYTESGYTARLVSKHRPACPIVGLSRHPEICRQMGLLWGVRALSVREMGDLDHLVVSAESLLRQQQLAAEGDLICLVAGTPFLIPGKTDLIKLHRIGRPEA